MTNQEKKRQILQDFLEKYKHLDGYCTITCRGLEGESPYFHPIMELDEQTKITSQGDVGNEFIYAFRFVSDKVSLDISDDILEQVIIGYENNKDIVLECLKTIYRIRQHIGNLNEYVTTYVVNKLTGASSKDITKDIINELKLCDALVDSVKNKSN